MKKLTLLFCSLVLLSKSQDTYFIMQNQSLLNLNAAYAGSNGGFRTQSIFSNYLFNTNTTNYYLFNSADVYLPKAKGAIGGTFTYANKADGLFKNYNTGLSYAQYIKLTEGLKLIPAITIGFLNYTVDASKLTFGDMIDARRGFIAPSPEPLTNTSKSNVFINTSFLLHHKLFNVGFVANQLNQPDVGILGPYRLPIRYTLHAATQFNIVKDMALQLTARGDKQLDFYFYQFSTNLLLYNKFTIGGGFRYYNTLFANFGFRNDWFGIYALAGARINSSITSLTILEIAATFNVLKKINRKTKLNYEEM